MLWGTMLLGMLLVQGVAAEEGSIPAPLLSHKVLWQQKVEGPDPYYVTLLEEQGDYSSLAFFCREGDQWKLTYSHRPQRIMKVAVADLDLDGQPEIIIGLKPELKPDERAEGGLQVYRWKNRRLFPLWLGNKMDKPFKDFAVARLGREDRLRLITLEPGPQRSRRDHLVVYRWTGFGFLGSYEIPVDGQVLSVEKAGDEIWSFLKIQAKKEGKQYTCYMECFDRGYQKVKKKLLRKEYEWQPLLGYAKIGP